MLLIDQKLSWKHIDFKRYTLPRKSTMDSLLAAIANQPQTSKIRLLDTKSWRRAHPVQTDGIATYAVPSVQQSEPHDEHDYQLQGIQNMERQVNFATRFRKR